MVVVAAIGAPGGLEQWQKDMCCAARLPPFGIDSRSSLSPSNFICSDKDGGERHRPQIDPSCGVSIFCLPYCCLAARRPALLLERHGGCSRVVAPAALIRLRSKFMRVVAANPLCCAIALLWCTVSLQGMVLMHSNLMLGVMLQMDSCIYGRWSLPLHLIFQLRLLLI